MCGIIAYSGQKQALPIVLEGLRKLEYRGYDSAGIALLSRKKIKLWKKAGKLAALESVIDEQAKGHCAIGHTRWATHGEPNDVNAHPHTDNTGRVAIVHNGIIENANSIRKSLEQAGVKILSDTDSELLAHLIALELVADEAQQPEWTDKNESRLLSVARRVLTGVTGTYGLAIIDRDEAGTMVVARNGSPVIIGIGEGEMLAASDMSALLRHTRELVYLDEGEIAELNPTGFHVTTLDAKPTTKASTMVDGLLDEYNRGGYEHYLHREIMDQPEVLRRTLSGRIDHRFASTRLGGLNLEARDLLNFDRIKILGCGSALYAGMAGAQMIETLARLSVDAEPAAEFRYRNPVIDSKTLYLVVSQSGETFDTLAAVREIKRKGGVVLGIVNSVGSTIAREVDGGVYMHAGPEVSVASTKAYTSMLTVFSLLAIMLGRIRDVSPQHGNRLLEGLESLPELIEDVLKTEEKSGAIESVATSYCKARSCFFVGRVEGFPVALEGAQKLKEVSYIHAEAYPASELKHGPLALLTTKTPCVVVLPDNDLLSKSIASLEEIKARKAPTIAITDATGEPLSAISKLSEHVLTVPPCPMLCKPVVMAVVLQLYAYHSAMALGRDIDQPRNLAKSVTVE